MSWASAPARAGDGTGTGGVGAAGEELVRVALAGEEVAGLLRRCSFPSPAPPPEGELTCAVSGGADSLALMVLAAASGLRVSAIHVDHGLREGSAAEADFVAAAARSVGASFRAVAVEVAPGPNLEARARAARYRALGPRVATGHTMDDQAETVLANLLRGSGPDGLSGMRPGPEHPLLGLRRAETRQVCASAGLDWVHDPSNDDLAYLRNRIRHRLIPLCAEVAGRDPVPLLARLAGLAAADSDLLELLAGEAVPDATDAAALRRAPDPLARRAVRRWLRELGATAQTGGRASPDGRPRHQPPNRADVGRILAVARGAAVGTQVSGGWRVRRRAGRLVAQPPVSVESR